MPRRVVMHREGASFDLVEVPAPNEHHLQEVVKSQPQLIPADDLGLDGDLLVVGRETALASGYIDLLCVSRTGEIVLIEFKTGPQNPDFRHALAQLIDYGADLWRLDVDDFDRGVVQRYLSSAHVDASARGARTLRDAVARTGWSLADEEYDAFSARIAEVLATGDFHYVVAAQRFTPSMQLSLEYMNASTRVGRYFLVEVIQLEGAELTAHAAQVVAAPAKRQATRSAGGSESTTDAAAFLAQIDDDAYRDAVRDLLATFEALGLEVWWRSKGASIRLPVTDRNAPLSIAWLFPEGSNWQGANHVTLGVDYGSLAQTPSVDGPVRAYVERVKQLPGGRQPGGNPDGAIFDPATFPRVVDGAIAALSDLMSGVNGEPVET